jgi:uncharacterized membrane protein HdeD (DUF308 family)/predicted flap endonuclease-1-like 5' DNA nuclease
MSIEMTDTGRIIYTTRVILKELNLTIYKFYIKIYLNFMFSWKWRNIMTTAMDRSDNRSPVVPWWLVLIEGILAIIVGILLWMYPVRGFIWLSRFIGFYWIISGIFDIISIFVNRTNWGWKLFMGIIGIIAGGYLVSQALAGAATLAITTVWIIGLMGIFYGLLGLIRAFQGGGWGAGILGIVSIIFGVYILVNRLAATLAIPWVFGFLGIFGGILAIFTAFALRSAAKNRKSVPTQVRMAPTPAVAQGSAEVSAAPVGAAAVTTVAAKVDESAPVEVATRFEGISDAGTEVVEENLTPVEMPIGEPGLAAESAAALAATAAEDIVAEDDVAASVETITGEASAVDEDAAGIIYEKSPEPVVADEEPKAVEIPDVVVIPEEQAHFLKQEIEYVEGIGPVFGGKLRAIGVNTPLDLLRKGATRKGRDLIAEASGITGTLILKWVNHTDLYRLKGVGSEYADLLEAAGVDTVVELATRNPTNLHNKLVSINEEKKLVRQVPSPAQIEHWVEQAKQLGRVVSY